MAALAFQPAVVEKTYMNQTLKANEDDLVDNSLYLNEEFLKLLQEDYYYNHIYQSPTYHFNRAKFLKHYAAWQNKVAFLSDVNRIIDDEDFKAIVDMEVTAIPFILEELEAKPVPLVWAINKITKSKISDQPISIKQASDLWIKWGRNRKIIV